MFSSSQLAFKRMLSLHAKEMMYLPKQIIVKHNTNCRSLMYLSRGELEVSTITVYYYYY